MVDQSNIALMEPNSNYARFVSLAGEVWQRLQ